MTEELPADRTIAAELPDPVSAPTASIELDWVGYFKAFSEAHGGNPLVHGGRLLFPDGWRYSASDYAGPEWAPPDDPEAHRALLRAYWGRRKGVVNSEARQLRGDLDHLRGLQSVRKVPLQALRYVKVTDPETGTSGYKAVSGPLDLTAMEGRLAWLQDDLTECDRVLAALRNAKPSPATERMS